MPTSLQGATLRSAASRADGCPPHRFDPPLTRSWHPVALSAELVPGGWLQVRLGGRTWSLRRNGGGLLVDPPVFDAGERHGVVWLAVGEPAERTLDVPEFRDPYAVVGRLAPVRAAGPPGPLLDALVGPHDPPALDPPALDPPALDASRTTTVTRAPGGLRRRVEHPSGAACTLVVVLQPEDAESTRAYGCLFLSTGPGRPLPAPRTVAAAVARSERALAGVAGVAARRAHRAVRDLATSGEEPLPPEDPLGGVLRSVLDDLARG